jgi:hypothetical protein
VAATPAPAPAVLPGVADPAAAAATVVAATTPGAQAPTTAASPATLPAAGWGTPRASARLFVSGHSLTDNPLGEQVVAIANSLGGGQAAKYNQQIVIGSPIANRTDQPANWAGYSRGKNRDGSGMNVVQELRAPRTLGGDRYDTLVIAERHDLVSVVQWENTVRYLRHFHERLLDGQPQGRTFFYETWWNVPDKRDPGPWVAHERAASRAWQCVVARVNHSLAAEGRADRIVPLPAGAALADLVEQAAAGRVPGLSAATPLETLNRLFSDDVHLTPTGVYYMALVTYASVYERSPVGAWAPAGITAGAASALQERAWQFVQRFYTTHQPAALDECRSFVAQQFCPVYWQLRQNTGAIADCTRTFSALDAGRNPLYYDAATDRRYWFAAP